MRVDASFLQGYKSPGARWIRMGLMTLNYYVHRGNCGFPGGICFHWCGQISFGQPSDFLTWPELHRTLLWRLKYARLAEMAVAIKVPPKKIDPFTGRQLEVWMLVCRAKFQRG